MVASSALAAAPLPLAGSPLLSVTLPPPVASPAPATAPPPLSDFELTATERDFSLYFPTYLANGFLAAQSSLRGTEATLTQLAGVMDYTPGDVSRPAAIPSWTQIDYFNGQSWLNSSPVQPATFQNYEQTLDMYGATLSTRYDWVDGTRTSRIAVTSFVSEDNTHLAVSSLTLTPDFDGRIRVRLTLRPWPAFSRRLALGKLSLPQAKEAIAALYHLPAPPPGMLLSQMLRPPTPTAANRASIWYPGTIEIGSSGAALPQRLLWVEGKAPGGDTVSEVAAMALPSALGHPRVTLERTPEWIGLIVEADVVHGRAYEFTKFVAASTGGWGSLEEGTRIVKQARAAGLESTLRAHQGVWHDLWRSDIRVAGDDSLQRSIHSDLFYLLENSSIGTASPMAACAASPHYLGHIFWDNDSWDFPVMLLLHPERARSQIAFRFKTLDAARERARQHGYRGAMFPWEADPLTGVEETPFFAHENAQREIHINGDVAIAQWQYYLATGDRDWLRQFGYPVIQATADFWTSRATWRPEVNRYEILHVTSPDEAYNDVNNDSFTNAVAQRNLVIATSAARELGIAPAPEWEEVATRLYIPFSNSEQRHLDFDSSTPHDKQTWLGSALSFLAYPQLDLAMSPQVRRNDFDFALRSIKEQTPDANAMMLAMISLDAAELGDDRQAEKWLDRQQQGFLKPPFNVRSETVLNNTTYILATSSGFLQNFLFGFSGLRIGAGGLEERYPATLPAHWRALTLTNVAIRGQRFDYRISRNANGSARLERTPVREGADVSGKHS